MTPLFGRHGPTDAALTASIALALATLGLWSSPARAANLLTGWNLAGAEFGSLPGQHGHDYIYPNEAELDYLVAKGMNTLRLPFRWERMQPRLFEELSAPELSLLRATVAAAKRRSLAVVLDVHNYARFEDQVVGLREVPDTALADLWRRLATVFRSEPRVLFGLMNEPHDLPTTVWFRSANAAVAAIRATGAQNLILVPGTGWTGAHSWSAGGAEANATVMAGIADPCGNLAYEVHQYFDSDYSGTKAVCTGREGALEGLQAMTTWLRARGARGFLGEFGAGAGAPCDAAVSSALSILAENPETWLGWTAWAAGPWWDKEYPLSLEPQAGKDRPQVSVLARFAARRPAPEMATCRKPG